MISIIIDANNTIHTSTAEAFANGLRVHNIKHEILPLNPKTARNKYDQPVTFGWIKNNPTGQFRKTIIGNHPNVIILERGFVKRQDYFMVGRNGLNGNAEYYNDNSPPDRWDKLGVRLGSIKAKECTKSVLLAGQVVSDASVRNINYRQWCHQTYMTLKARFETVAFREHPLNHTPIGLPSDDSPMDECLDKYDLIMAYNSNVGVEAFIYGKLTAFCNKGSMLKKIGHEIQINHTKLTIADFLKRKQWANNLAYTQWTHDEMSSGECFNYWKPYV